MRATYFWNLKGSWRHNTSLCQKGIFLSPFRTTNDALFTEKLSILRQDFHSPTKSCVLWHCRWCLQGTHLTWKFVGWLRLLWMVKQSFVLPCLRFAFLDGRTMPSRTIVCTCSVFFYLICTQLTFVIVDSNHLWKIGHACQSGSSWWQCRLCQVASVMADKCNCGQRSVCRTHWCFYAYAFVHNFHCLLHHCYCFKKGCTLNFTANVSFCKLIIAV